MMQAGCNRAPASLNHVARPIASLRQAAVAKKSLQKSAPERMHWQESRRRTCARAASSRGKLPSVTQPSSCNDVDRDLWMVLDLASDEELEGVHDILFGELSVAPTRVSSCCHSVFKISRPR